jgi:hypothetical protein
LFGRYYLERVPELPDGFTELQFRATWKDIDYTVTFDGNGGILATSGLDVKPGSYAHVDLVEAYTVVGDLNEADKLSTRLPLSVATIDGETKNYPLRPGYTFRDGLMRKAYITIPISFPRNLSRRIRSLLLSGRQTRIMSSLMPMAEQLSILRTA